MGLELLDAARAVAEFDLLMRVLGRGGGAFTDGAGDRAVALEVRVQLPSPPLAARSSFASQSPQGARGNTEHRRRTR